MKTSSNIRSSTAFCSSTIRLFCSSTLPVAALNNAISGAMNFSSSSMRFSQSAKKSKKIFPVSLDGEIKKSSMCENNADVIVLIFSRNTSGISFSARMQSLL